MTNNLKNIIIILTILSILICVVLVVLFTKEKEQQNVLTNEIEYVPDLKPEEEVSKNISILKNENEFFTIESILQNYFLYLKVENANAVYSVLDNNYMQQNNINSDNVITQMKQKTSNYNGSFQLVKVYVRNSLKSPIYYAYGILKENKNEKDFYAVIYLDRSNSAYSIALSDNKQYEQYITEKVKEQTTKEITQKKYNKFKMVSLTKEELAKKYFEDYIYQAMSYTQKAYNLINSEYRKNKFATINDYKKYLDNRKEVMNSLNAKGMKTIEDFETEEEYTNYLNNLTFKGIKQYKFSETNNKKQCICIDDYENYYIFDITGAMQYTVILDTYTIDLPEFTTKYEKASDEEKVLMNIQKFFDAIEDGDYKYAYGKLDETFKNNNFKSQAAFEDYVKKNFFSQNKLSAGKAEQQGNVFLYNVTIADASKKNSKTITRSFVMQLKEGTDFVMSFGVQ